VEGARPEACLSKTAKPHLTDLTSINLKSVEKYKGKLFKIC
jgi:hypothetical protein